MEITANKTLAGTWGTLWIDGMPVMEFKKVEAKVTVNREDIQLGVDADTKMLGLKGEISVTIVKVYDRYNTILANYKKGKDVRSQVITKLADPDAVNGGVSRYSFDNVWWNDLPVVIMEKGSIIEEELTGGFPPTQMMMLDQIAVA